MKPKYIYHYHASFHESGRAIELDGIVTCEHPIDSMDRFREAKKAVIGDAGDPVVFSIDSLSLLNPYDFAPAPAATIEREGND